MRFDFAYEMTPVGVEFDVLFCDAVGGIYTASTVTERGLGGTETQIIWIAEALAQLGYRVGILNAGPFASVSPAGVRYFPLGDLSKNTIHPKTEHLISIRMGVLPSGIDFNRLHFWLHDIPDERLRPIHDILGRVPDADVVCVSEWQRGKCPPGWESRTRVIHNAIPDWVYDVKYVPANKDFVYASAALKGLDATIEIWNKMRGSAKQVEKSTLRVLSPGYDAPGKNTFKHAKGAQFIGPVPFAEVVNVLSTSRGGLFYVNTLPETFGIVPVLAEIVGAPLHVLCVNETGALSEVLNTPVSKDFRSFENGIKGEHVAAEANDFRVSTQVKRWVEFLGLKGKELAA